MTSPAIIAAKLKATANVTVAEGIEILDEAIAKRREVQAELTKKAFEEQYLIDEKKAQLKAIPLYKRIFFYTRYNPLRREIKEHEGARFAYVAMMLGNSREIIRFERARNKLNAQSSN